MSCQTDWGALILLVGNSGSGKDSLINWVLSHWSPEKPPPIIPTRFITRPPSPETEDYKSVTLEHFQNLSKAGAFLLQWESYGILYGVPREIEDELARGKSVLVNVSRQIVESTKKNLPHVYVIFIRVPFHITAERIRARGREQGTSITERLERARLNQEFPTADYVVDNSGDLDAAGQQLLTILLEIIS